MGKKIIFSCLSIIIFCSILISCGNSTKSIIGTWYSSKPDTIVINKDNTFTSTWLGNGTYSIKDDVITFKTTFDNSTKAFKIAEENNKKVLYYYEDGKDKPTYIYYDNQEKVEQLKKENLENMKKELIADWKGISTNLTGKLAEDTAFNLVLNDDGTYVHEINYTGNEAQVINNLQTLGATYGSGTYKLKENKNKTDEFDIDFTNSKGKSKTVHFKIHMGEEIKLVDETSKVEYKK